MFQLKYKNHCQKKKSTNKPKDKNVVVFATEWATTLTYLLKNSIVELLKTWGNDVYNKKYRW